MNFKIPIALLLLILGTHVGTRAQTAKELGLKLDGKVEYCEREERQDRTKSCYKLRMTLTNNGSQPVIVINPNLGYGTGLKAAIFDFNYRGPDPETGEIRNISSEEINTFEASPAEIENFKAMAPLLDDERPPENMTITLQPGDTLTFEDKFKVKIQSQLRPDSFVERKDPVTGKSVKSPIHVKRISASGFRLVYEYSFLPYIADPDFLEHLSLRWQRYGVLPVGTNGTYTITSRRFARNQQLAILSLLP